MVKWSGSSQESGPNAKVLPVPVWAVPSKSLPSKAKGIESNCMGVGSDKFKFLSAANIGDVRLKSENFFIYIGMMFWGGSAYWIRSSITD